VVVGDPADRVCVVCATNDEANKCNDKSCTNERRLYYQRTRRASPRICDSGVDTILDAEHDTIAKQ
jgi:hypothetical protein